MERLENKVSRFAEKHPVITTLALIKLAESALVAGTYMLWPEETTDVLKWMHETGKYGYACLSPISPVIATYTQEMSCAIRNLPATAPVRTISDFLFKKENYDSDFFARSADWEERTYSLIRRSLSTSKEDII